MFKQNKKVVVKSLMVLLLSWILLPQGVFVGEVVAQSVPADNQNTSAWKSAEQKQRESIISMTTFMETISKVSYVLLWPLVALAWLAMDNSLVYWSFIWFDVSLWKIWQIVRTFANYTLWVLFLVWILIYNFSPTWKVFWSAVKDWKDLIVKTLIASVLIQASWFIMMALVDLSTVLTYTVWSLPTLVINADEKEDSRMLQQFTLLNLWNSTASANADIWDAIIWYWGATTWNKTTYVAPCEVYSTLNQSFIIWRKFDSLTWKDNSWNDAFLNMAPWYCVYFWKLISFRDFDTKNTKLGETYKERLQTFINDMSSAESDNMTKLVSWWIILPISSWKLWYLSWWAEDSPVKLWEHEYWDKIWCNNDNTKIWAVPSVMSGDAFECLYTESSVSLNNLIKKSTSMVWPFSALYSNLSTFSSFDVSQGLWIWQKFIVMLVNIVFSILLVLPLWALVIVLFARIGILWFVIGLSPFIVLINVFEWLFKINLPINVKYKDIFAVLIAPVLVSFAVSLALVFMTTLKNAVWPGFGSSTEATATVDGKDAIKNISWMEYDWSNLNLLWFIKIKLDNVMLNISWLILMIFGLWVTWFLLFRAIKASWSVWKKVWTMFESIWETAMKNMPIIPINWWALTFQSLQDTPSLINQKLSSATNASEENLRNLFRKQWFLDAGQSKWFMEYYNFNSGSDAKDVFSKLSEVQSQERWWIYSKQNDVKDAIQNYMKDKTIPEAYLGKKWKFWDKTYRIKKWSEENAGYQFVEDVPTESPQGTSPEAPTQGTTSQPS